MIAPVGMKLKGVAMKPVAVVRGEEQRGMVPVVDRHPDGNKVVAGGVEVHGWAEQKSIPTLLKPGAIPGRCVLCLAERLEQPPHFWIFVEIKVAALRGRWRIQFDNAQVSPVEPGRIIDIEAQPDDFLLTLPAGQEAVGMPRVVPAHIDPRRFLRGKAAVASSGGIAPKQ